MLAERINCRQAKYMIAYVLVMANIKSQIKRNRQTEVITVRNKDKRSALKNLVANLNAAIEKKDKKKAAELFTKTSRALDKAASSGIIHKARAASRKSAFSRRISSLK